MRAGEMKEMITNNNRDEKGRERIEKDVGKTIIGSDDVAGEIKSDEQTFL